jgi:hypothetical protein
MKILEDFRDIIGKHPLIGHAALVLLVLGSTFFVQPAYWGLQPPYLNALVTMISALLVIIPLGWRRFFLITVLVFVSVIVVVPDVLNFIGRVNLSSIASIIAVFSKAAYGGRRRNLICFASIITFNGGLVYKLIIRSNTGFLSSATLFNVTGLFWNLLTFSAIWWFGNTMRISRERTFLPSTSTEKVVLEILAYNIRVMSIQAGTARQLLKQYPEKVLNLLNHIKHSIRYIVVKVCRKFNPLWDEKHFESGTTPFGVRQLEK